MKLSGFVRNISGHGTGYLFETHDKRKSWQVDQSNELPTVNKLLEVEAIITDETIKIVSWHIIVEGEESEKYSQPLRLGVYYSVRVGSSSAHKERMQRISQSTAKEMLARLKQENPPWQVIEVRGTVIESNVGTHPPVFFRTAIFEFLDTGIWGDWVPTDHLTFGGPQVFSAGGHNSGAFSSVYTGGGIKLGSHEMIGHGQDAPHNKDFNLDGSTNEYSRILGSDWMGSVDRRMNSLSRNSMGLLWDDHVLQSTNSISAVLAPVESIPSAIPISAYNAVVLGDGNANDSIYLSQRTTLGILTSNAQADSVHVHHRRGGNYTIAVIDQGEEFEYNGWIIKPLGYVDGLVHVSATKVGEQPPPPPLHPTQPLPVSRGIEISADHSGIWEDKRFEKQGLYLFYSPSRVLGTGEVVPESINGCWFTQTQNAAGRGTNRWMTVQGDIVDGVAEVIVRDEVDGSLNNVGYGRIAFHDKLSGEFQFVLDGHRGQMLLTMGAKAGEGSGWWCDSDQINGRRHEGVLVLKSIYGQAAWLFQPSQWRYMDLDKDMIGKSYIVTSSSFLNTREAHFSDPIDCEITIVSSGLLELLHDGEVIVMDEKLI